MSNENQSTRRAKNDSRCTEACVKCCDSCIVSNLGLPPLRNADQAGELPTSGSVPALLGKRSQRVNDHDTSGASSSNPRPKSPEGAAWNNTKQASTRSAPLRSAPPPPSPPFFKPPSSLVATLDLLLDHHTHDVKQSRTAQKPLSSSRSLHSLCLRK